MPEKTPVDWFNEDSSSRHAAQLWFEDNWLYVENDAGERRHAPVADTEISSRLGNIPRRIKLPDGVHLSVSDNDFIDRALTANAMHKTAALVHRLERHWRWVAVLTAAAAMVIYAGAVVGVPKLAEVVAEQVPQSYLQEMTDVAYDGFVEEEFLQNSRLSDFQQRRVEKIFAEVASHYPDEGYDIRLRIHRFAFSTDDDAFTIANAFALPDGLIIITDDLALELRNDEIAAIIAHEIGHVRQRHALRGLVQASGIALFFTLALGDFSGTILIPTTLLQFKYSRNAERDADCHAYDYLKHRNLPPTLIGDALKKIEDEWRENDEDEVPTENDKDVADRPVWGKFIELLSTHPATHARTDLATVCASAD